MGFMMFRWMLCTRVLPLRCKSFYAKAASTVQQPVDPIQKAFVEKLREYQVKANTADLGLVDASEAQLKNLRDSMEKLDHAFGAKNVDMTQFPTLTYEEPALANPGSKIVVEYPKPESFEDAEPDERIDGVLTKGPIVI